MPGMPGMPGHHDSDSKFTMRVLAAPTVAGNAGDLRFQILDAKGKPVTQYDVLHERQLHLFAVRDTGAAPSSRFTDFQHVHPQFSAADGTWTLPGFAASSAGSTKLFADFSTGGAAAIAQAAIAVSGTASAPTDNSGGYSAKIVQSMAIGDAIHAVVQLLGPDGKPVAAVDPFLGAPAHWALFGASSATSAVDVAHAHPMDALKDGKLSFHVETQPHDAYQGWLQFQPAGGKLVTVPLSLPAGN